MKSTSKLLKKYNNTFISISIFFKVFKNLCLNKNDETLFLKNAYQLFLLIEFGEKLYNIFKLLGQFGPLLGLDFGQFGPKINSDLGQFGPYF